MPSPTSDAPGLDVIDVIRPEGVWRVQKKGEVFERLAIKADGTVFAGSGATAPTPVTAALVSVKAYGATGDGTTDDTAAIQAAIDARYGVYFPAGTYKCRSPLTLRNGSRLVGEARGVSAAAGPVVQIDSRVVGLTAFPWAIKIAAGSVDLGQGVVIENLWVKGVAASSVDWTQAAFPSSAPSWTSA